MSYDLFKFKVNWMAEGFHPQVDIDRTAQR